MISVSEKNPNLHNIEELDEASDLTIERKNRESSVSMSGQSFIS